MSASVTTFIRLLGALEDLVAQESMQLAGENYEAVRQTQERAAPLVTELVRLGADAAKPAMQPRLEALLERRRKNQDLLAARIRQVRVALQDAQTNQRRIAQIAPAYSRSASLGSLRQLSALG